MTSKTRAESLTVTRVLSFGSRWLAPRDTEKKGSVPSKLQRIRWLTGSSSTTRRRTAKNRKADEPLIPSDEFELIHELGSGGLGRVWSARKKSAGQLVAIKVLHDELDTNSEDFNRFLED